MQGELLPWLPVSQSQPKDRPEMVKALQVLIQNHKQMQSQLTTDGQGPIEDMVGALIFVVQVAEKTEAFMENSRRLANTAARLEQNKEEVAIQVCMYSLDLHLCHTVSKGGGGGLFATCSYTSASKSDSAEFEFDKCLSVALLCILS